MSFAIGLASGLPNMSAPSTHGNWVDGRIGCRYVGAGVISESLREP